MTNMWFARKYRKWNRLERGSCAVNEALNLADSFTAACRASEPIPAWALALRALACRVRMQRAVLAKKAEKS